MAANSGSFLHMTTAADTGTLGGAGSGTILNAVNVNTGAASAVLTLRLQNSSGAIIAVIDASAKGSYYFNALCPNGVYCALTGGNADVTIS